MENLQNFVSKSFTGDRTPVAIRREHVSFSVDDLLAPDSGDEEALSSGDEAQVPAAGGAGLAGGAGGGAQRTRGTPAASGCAPASPPSSPPGHPHRDASPGREPRRSTVSPLQGLPLLICSFIPVPDRKVQRLH